MCHWLNAESCFSAENDKKLKRKASPKNEAKGRIVIKIFRFPSVTKQKFRYFFFFFFLLFFCFFYIF